VIPWLHDLGEQAGVEGAVGEDDEAVFGRGQNGIPEYALRNHHVQALFNGLGSWLVVDG